jgi:hypothetical protein
MIGTTFKLGFDGTSVGKGLGKMSGLLGRFGKQIGVGMAQKIGHGVTDLMGRIVMAVPEALKETADWAGNMNDMANQTGVSIQKLVQMEEALRISGASARDTSKMISTLADNLNTAATEGGPAIDAMQKLGLTWGEWANLPVDRQFENIMRRVGELEPGFKGLETIMADLFGARMGYKLIRFARQFDGNMADAADNVRGLSLAMQNDAPAIDQFFDGLGRIENFKRSLASIGISEVMRLLGGPDRPDRMFDFIDPEKLRPKIRKFVDMMRNTFIYMREEGGIGRVISDMGKDIGKSIGAGIMETISPGNMFKGIFGGKGGKKTANPSKDLSALIEKSNTLLADIRKEVGVAKFA